MIYMKIHDTENGKILAMCDEELLGRIFSEGKRELDLNKYSDFYNGELVGEQEAKKRIEGIEIYCANAVGQNSVQVLKSRVDISEGDVKIIEKVPFVQIYTLI